MWEGEEDRFYLSQGRFGMWKVAQTRAGDGLAREAIRGGEADIHIGVPAEDGNQLLSGITIGSEDSDVYFAHPTFLFLTKNPCLG